MRHIRLTLAYDGTAYAGWQFQPNVISVQGRIEEAILATTGEAVRIVGAGRTDAGVHATGQVAAYRTATTIPVGRIARVLNARLPCDIAVLAAAEARERFNPRRDAAARCYKYVICESKIANPFRDRFVWRVGEGLDVAAMADAARLLIGRHDFAAFGAPMYSGGPTERTISALRVGRRGRIVHVTIWGDAFLKGMVRTIVEALAEVGWGRRRREEIEEWIGAARRGLVRFKAPACGLYLAGVRYGARPLYR
jgi:tRNA pseudouridine38-40 synthase